jgi:hypothetical protein
VQFVLEFVPATPNRFRMQAGNLRQALEAAVPQQHSLPCRHPTALLLVQAAKQKVELAMIVPCRLFTRLAGLTMTLVNRRWCAHGRTPFLGVPDSLHQTAEFTE